MENNSNHEGYFLISLGEDTIGIEHYKTKGPEVEGEVLLRVSQKTLRRYSLQYKEDGKLKLLELQDRALDDQNTLVNSYSMHAQGDTIEFEFSSRGGKVNKITRTGGVNIVGLGVPPFAMYEKLIETFHQKEGEGMGFISPLTDALELKVKQVGEGKYLLHNSFIRNLAITVNANGELESVDGFGNAQLSFRAKRLDPTEGKAMMESWITDPALPLVQIVSPTKKESYPIGNAIISLTYGSPSTRGRKIFGGLIPFGKVWRTGADWATHIEFDKPLRFGEKIVDAGTYTLYTIPDPDHWQFLLNKQTGQWGVLYDEQHEVLRLSMETRKVPEICEQLSISVEEAGSRGAIVIRWDDVESKMLFDVIER